MSFAPIALTMPQYDPTLYAGYWLKAYEQGTTTPLIMATDATGGTTVARSELDTQGFPLTAGSARFIPFINGDYDLWLFPTSAEADSNDTSNAIQLADNLNADPDSTGQLSLWDTNLSYDIPEIILGSDDNYYRSLIDSNSGNDPISSAVQWELLVFGRIWNTNITYAIGDSVYGSDGLLYIARVSQSGNDPAGSADLVNWNGALPHNTVASAVVTLKVIDSATGDNVTLQTSGEPDIGIDFEASEGEEILKLTPVPSAVNEAEVTSAIAVAIYTDVNTLAFVAPNQITDSGNGFGIFTAGDIVEITGATAANNNDKFIITTAVAGQLDLDGLTITNETPSGSSVVVTSQVSAKISATGDDTNIGLNLTGKGTGSVNVRKTPVYGKVLFDVPKILITDTTTAAVGNTPVDISAFTTLGTAVKAILNVNSDADGSATGTSEILAFEGGQSALSAVHRATYLRYVSNDTSDTNQITVNLTASEIFDYFILQTGTAPTTRTVTIYLAGYYV